MKSAFFAFLFGFLSIAAAKSADDYYHGSGYKYIAGRQQEASVEVQEGLRNFPDDPRLQSLASLLKKMQDQQKQDQNQEGEGEKQPDSDQKEKDSQDKKNEKPGEKQPDKSPQDSSGKDEKKQPDKADKQPPQDSSREDSQAAGQPKPGQMSKEEAEQLLNSFADDEKKEQRKLRAHPGKQPQVEQDW